MHVNPELRKRWKKLTRKLVELAKVAPIHPAPGDTLDDDKVDG